MLTVFGVDKMKGEFPHQAGKYFLTKTATWSLASLMPLRVRYTRVP